MFGGKEKKGWWGSSRFQCVIIYLAIHIYFVEYESSHVYVSACSSVSHE